MPVQPLVAQLTVGEWLEPIFSFAMSITSRPKLAVTFSPLAERKSIYSLGQIKKRPLSLTSAGKIHEVTRASPDLGHNPLVLENGAIQEAGSEKFLRDACQSWFVHQQDRATIGVDLPLPFEENVLGIRPIPVSPMRLVSKECLKLRLTLHHQPQH
jgi:hypothetical protein